MIGSRVLNGWQVNVLQRLAEVDPGDDTTAAPRAATEYQGTNEGLHAKTFILDLPGRRSTVVTGSANLTGTTWRASVEFDVVLTGPTWALRGRGNTERLARGPRPDPDPGELQRSPTRTASPTLPSRPPTPSKISTSSWPSVCRTCTSPISTATGSRQR